MINQRWLAVSLKAPAWLPCLGGVLLIASDLLYARDFYFSPTAVDSDVTSTISDLTIFSNPKAQLPGRYPTYVRLNNQRLEQRELNYINGADGALEAQLSPAILRKWGIKVDDYPELLKLPPDAPLPHPLGWYIPAASSVFNFSTQTLDLSLPQKSLEQHSAGFVDQS